MTKNLSISLIFRLFQQDFPIDSSLESLGCLEYFMLQSKGNHVSIVFDVLSTKNWSFLHFPPSNSESTLHTQRCMEIYLCIHIQDIHSTVEHLCKTKDGLESFRASRLGFRTANLGPNMHPWFSYRNMEQTRDIWGPSSSAIWFDVFTHPKICMYI